MQRDYNRIWNKSCWTWRMTFMFGFNVNNIVSTRTTVMTLVFITYYNTTRSLLIFENLFCLPAKKVITCVLFCFKLLYLYDFQPCKYHLNYCTTIIVFSCDMMFLTGCAMFRMWDIWDVGCWDCAMFGVWDIENWDVWGVGRLAWGMFGVWGV